MRSNDARLDPPYLRTIMPELFGSAVRVKTGAFLDQKYSLKLVDVFG